MDIRTITTSRLTESVIAVPPLARDRNLQLDAGQNRRLIQFMEAGGITTLLYGGNAVLYHARVSEYSSLLQMLVESTSNDTLVVPSVGPAFGTMMDQAEILRDFDFPTVMVLPQKEIADAHGIASGIRRFAEALGKPIVLYLKHDQWLPSELVGKMHRGGIISWIKYAVVRDNPAEDRYLSEVLEHVPSEILVSGIGEQPAIVHLRDFEIASFTSGCVCVNPKLSMKMLRAIQSKDYDLAEQIRIQFQGLEDLRNGINPIRVLHRAVELADIAETGPMYPMLGELTATETSDVGAAANALKALE
ncbi:MAG: dihydrodipicolinate synthase family protein [Planctomycetales bacterium]|nr:dihydrodipicolinate synthase family protein [Planctomycetales bacterium]